MKTVGLLGGMSWESTSLYYKMINELVRNQLGGLHSAKICMVSVDFHEIEQLQFAGEWQKAGELLAEQARKVESGGADFLLLCTNTMHKVAGAIEGAITIPMLHLADATASAIKQDGKRKVGLLGTRFTMEQEFYKGRLEQQGLEVIIPDDRGMQRVHDIIFDELCKGVVRNSSRQSYLEIMDSMIKQGAEGIILGCTEICMLVNQTHAQVPLFNTTEIHAAEAVKLALT